MPADLSDILLKLKEVEELLQFPLVDGHMARAETLLMLIARNAPSGVISHAAMNVITLAHLSRKPAPPMEADHRNLNRLLARIRRALELHRQER